jgi:hypothetical protein
MKTLTRSDRAFVEQEELAGWGRKVQELFAFGDPPEPAGIQLEFSSDRLGPGLGQVVGQEQALGRSGGRGDEGPMLLAEQPLQNSSLFNATVVGVTGLVDEKDASGVDRIVRVERFDAKEAAGGRRSRRGERPIERLGQLILG